MKKILTILFLLLTNFVNAQTTYYVSNGGNDANPGTILLPWATVAKVNSMWSSIAAGNHIAFQRGGKWNETITPTKSGAAGNPIVIEAYGTGANPIIGGSIVVSGWLSLGGNKYQSISTVSPESTINMVTFDSIPQRIARYPDYSASNKGYLTYNAVGGSKTAGGEAWVKLATSITINPNVKRFIVRDQRWSLKNTVYTRKSGDTIFYTQTNSYPGKTGYGCFFEGDSSYLTENGEWYHSPYTGKLVIYSTVNPSTLTIEASTKDVGIQSGSRSFFTVRNISFIGNNVAGILANKQALNNNTYADSTKGITLEDCYFRNAGREFVRMDNVVNGTINNCTGQWAMGAGFTINNLRGNGCTGAYVRNCNVNITAPYAGMEIGGDATGRSAITANANSLIEIMYNNIDSAGYAGYEAQGNNMLVYGNIGSNCLYVRDDGGIFYTYVAATYSAYSNRIIRKNIFYNAIGAPGGTNSTSSSARGIYFDENTNNITADSNTVVNTTGPAFYGNSVKDITITRNNVSTSANSWYYQKLRDGQIITTGLNITGNYFLNYTAGYSTCQVDNPFISSTQAVAMDSTLARLGTIDNNRTTISVTAPFSGASQKTGGTSYLTWSKTLTQWRALNKDVTTTVSNYTDWILKINYTGSDTIFVVADGDVWEDMDGNEYDPESGIPVSRYYSKFVRLKSTGGSTPQPSVNNVPVRVRARFF